MNSKTLAQHIDHTLLQPQATRAQIVQLALEALQFQFRTVCVESRWLDVVVPMLKDSPVLPITVVGFPQGHHPTSEKVKETESAVSRCAKEIDMVLNRDWLKAFRYRDVLVDIQSVVIAAAGIPVKVILETSELTDSQKISACTLCAAGGAHFVKTSTGFSKAGASAPDIRLMRQIVGPEMGVKASGGIRNLRTALEMIEAGASRLGSSASVAILSELEKGTP